MPKKQEKILDIPNTPIRFLIHVTKPFKKWAISAILVVIVAAALSQSTALFFKWIVEAVESGDKEKALFYGLLYPLAILVVQLLYRFSGWLGMHWTVKVKKRSTDLLFSYAIKHSHTYFSNRFAGSLLNKVANVVGSTDSLIHDFLWSYLATFVSLATTLYFIFTVDKFSGLAFISLVLTTLLVNRLRMKKKQHYSHLGAAANTKLRGSIVDVFTNIGAVRQFGSRQYEEEHSRALSRKWHDIGIKSWSYSEFTNVLNSIILFVFTTIILYLMVERWRLNEISTSEFVFVLALLSQLTGTLIFIGRAMTMYARVIGEAQEGLEELIIPYEIVDIPDAKKLIMGTAKVDWKYVCFEFGENKVFDNFNLEIQPGQRVGLVGHSGAGKTTFVSLLLRQHDVTGGAIEIDGQNIADVTQDSLRNAVAVVPQEPMLFHRTIRENIAYGKADATDEEIIAVAKKAQAHDFVMQLEYGYDTLVGERGIKLSGGQKQRVAIARAMLKNAPILVLDEATSALDSESEVAIQTALHELMEGKTVVAVAHRLSTLREMDRIIVMENGKIIEDGSHDTLKDSGGVYQRLWEHQAGGFLVE
jgi:ABC-type multidrug transport system fused ATPase/permease subunit